MVWGMVRYSKMETLLAIEDEKCTMWRLMEFDQDKLKEFMNEAASEATMLNLRPNVRPS